MIQRCESGRLIVDVKLPRGHNRKYETECEEGGEEGGRGAGGCQDYKFSSFRTAKRTEVENNPQPYPTQGGKLIKSLVTNRMPFPERSLKRMLVAN